ncbi:N-acetylglutaminylglutamine amidotransferase [Aromatoleum evansii]|uniref:N-acetylglutaminylglutamine amidotransferase n=1 Tax=Aromatoleum evansii TaxID=59406 RepID=UPI00145F43B5|nr:N-acetylglutaminylglutamine amidotransferase [Aromatoleum evansii]NMG29899.1 N-acetylglutaminylglutamine amidotransferase [Aromatoleum evansii]
MCGIAGEIRFDQTEADASAVGRMADTLRPRGPDAGGAFQQGRIALAHRRLKIIDLSERAQQPMVAADLGLTLVFNGCIYNYRELRAELEQEGERFFSDGDTEVLLRSYRRWGLGCVARLHGMFAFAIWERDSGRVVMARDRFGIKPLYLSESADGKRLRFASTLPAILAAGDVDTRIDPVALEHYLMWHAVVPPPHTMLRGVRKLPPATIAVFEADGRRNDMCYWNPPFATDSALVDTPYKERERMLQLALEKAVERRMVADVPVGVLLSGGVDSSLIVAMLARAGQKDLNTFSIGFEAANGEHGDEFKYSDLVAKEFGTRHHKIRVDGTTLLANLPDAIHAMSEPMVSYDNIGFYLLSKEVSKHVKVVQSGQGADEVLAGYHWYPPLAQSRDAVADYARVFFDRDEDEYLRTVVEAYASPGASRNFIARHFARPGAETPLDKALRIDATVMLVDDPVKRVDNMTMAWGLEARVPFLDHEFVELAARLPAADKLADDGKGILKAIARRVLPRDIIDRPKGYFPVPTLKYLSGPTLEWVKEALHGPAARERGLFRPAYIDQLLAAPDRHITPLRGSKLWQVALLELWLQAHGI